MKKSILIIVALAFLAFSAEAEAARVVQGYIKPSSGKYVQPHFRTNKNKTKIDNYSSKSNNNPFTVMFVNIKKIAMALLQKFMTHVIHQP